MTASNTNNQDSGKGSGDERFVCDECGSEHNTKRGLHSHMGQMGCGDVRNEIECSNCGDKIYRYDGYEDGNRFCSRDCYFEHNQKENHPQWNGGEVQVDCAYCGGSKTVKRHRAEKDKNFFCDKQCHGDYISETRTGDNHPRWEGGEHISFYGSNWDEQRKKALERDNTRCQRCGVDMCDLDSELHVHHIKKLRRFREKYDEPTWWEKGNKLENLVSLCPSCHQRWEGIPVKPELV